MPVEEAVLPCKDERRLTISNTRLRELATQKLSGPRLTCRECDSADDMADCARRKGDGDACEAPAAAAAAAAADGWAEDTDDALEAADVALILNIK